MHRGPGYWLDPNDGTLYLVRTHNDWLLVPENQRKIELPARHCEVLESLDPVREIDEIRIVGVMAGLVRIRDYGNRISVQFYAEERNVNLVLRSVAGTVPNVTSDKFPFLTIQNLRDDAVARLSLSNLLEKLNCGGSVLEPCPEPIPYNEDLRKKMDYLMKKAG